MPAVLRPGLAGRRDKTIGWPDPDHGKTRWSATAFGLIRSVAERLSAPIPDEFDDRAEAPVYVLALRGDEAAWGAVTSEPFPNDRPLWIGSTHDPLRLPTAIDKQLIGLSPVERDEFDEWFAEHCSVAAWAGEDAIEARWLVTELRERWRPPLI